jgi:hypothetical protein
MGMIRNTEVSSGNLLATWDRVVDGRILLKYVLSKYDMMMWN